MKTPEETKRNSLREIFQTVLREDIASLTPVSIVTKESFNSDSSETTFSFNQRISGKNKKVNLKAIEGRGFVDCLFRGCKQTYSDKYPSLLNVNLVDFKVRPVFSMKRGPVGSGAKTDIVLSVRVEERGTSEFTSRSDSIIRSAYATTLSAFQFYINCELAFNKIKIVLDDARSRHRGDILQRCMADLSKITEMNYFKA